MASSVILKVAPGPRGGGSQTVATFGGVQSMDLTWSWGPQPASAILQYVGDQAVVQDSSMTLLCPITNDPVTGAPIVPPGRLGYATFFGIAKKVVSTDSSAGRNSTIEFADMREFLHWDVVFGYFNRRVDLLVNGYWSKYYTHLLPGNVQSNYITYTSTAFTAAQILDFLFTAPTVHSPWVRLYHPAQVEDYVYDMDCSSGRKLADVVTEISQRQGLVFTLQGGMWQLVWAQKGVGYIPPTYADFPANSDHRRLGQARSELPDSVTVFGGRNRYQCLNIPMAPDWNQLLVGADSVIGADYVGFEAQFTDFVYNFMADPVSGRPYATPPDGDPLNLTGGMLAKARAETITLGELCDYFDTQEDGAGEAYRDRRKYNGRTRLDLPVLLYVKLLVFRAFALPANFQLATAGGNTLGPLACRIVPTNLVETTYDYVTGEMDYAPETAPGGNGLAIVQGFNFFTPPPLTWRSDQFDLAAWQNTQKLWQRVAYQIDDSGDQTQFIILDDPVAVSSDMLTVIDGHGVLNANATFEIPNVMASLVFEAESFEYYEGVNGVNMVENVADLNSDYVTRYGVFEAPTEIPFADGQYATQKAGAIANYILQQEPIFVLGGYTNRGCNGTQLSGTYDRVNLKLSAEGLTEDVDFTAERAANTFEPERDFARRIQLLQLAPGQADSRADARQIWGVVAALRHSPRITANLAQAFNDRYGSGEPLTNMTVDTD